MENYSYQQRPITEGRKRRRPLFRARETSAWSTARDRILLWVSIGPPAGATARREPDRPRSSDWDISPAGLYSCRPRVRSFL